MKRVVSLIALALAASTFSGAAADQRFFELRTYNAAPGKLDELHARFRDHTMKLFEKHGMSNIGYWVPFGNPTNSNPANQLIYLLAYPNRDAREKSWKDFMADPEWQVRNRPLSQRQTGGEGGFGLSERHRFHVGSRGFHRQCPPIIRFAHLQIRPRPNLRSAHAGQQNVSAALPPLRHRANGLLYPGRQRQRRRRHIDLHPGAQGP